MANDEDINVDLTYEEELYNDPFTVNHFLKRVYENRVRSDSANRADVRKTLDYLEEKIYEGTDYEQSEFARSIGFDSGEDVNIPIENWELNKDYSNDLSNIDWDAVEGFGFGRINPNTNQQWASLDEIYDFFNVTMDITGTGLDPAKGEVLTNHGWDHFNTSDNTSSKYPRIVGSDHVNHLKGLNGELQDNPYYYLTSMFVAGVSTGDYDKSSDAYFTEPGHVNLNANVAMNMFRFETSKLSPSNFNKFFGSNRSQIQPDYFHPAANVGDYSNALNGFTVSPYLTGYMSSKYLELNQMAIDEKGHWVFKGIEEDGVFVGKEKVFVDSPRLWHSSATDETRAEYRKSVSRTINLIEEHGGLTQGDFISKFGPSHELYGIFNSGNANTTGLSSKGTDINNHSFYAEQSDIPGFNLIYSAGNSMFALGINFDPTSNVIQSARFGSDFPTEAGVNATEKYGNVYQGLHYQSIKNMVATYDSQYFDDYIGRTNFLGRGFNAYLPLEESGILGSDYVMETDINISTGPGYGSARGDKLGTNAYLGWDAEAQGQLVLAQINADGYVDPTQHYAPYHYNGTEYSKFTIGRGSNPHTTDMAFGGGSFLNYGLPNFSNTLSYKMQDGSDFEHSNNLAYEQGEVSFKKFVRHILENAGKKDYYVVKSFQDLSEMYGLIINQKGLNVELLDDLGDEFKTIEATEALNSLNLFEPKF